MKNRNEFVTAFFDYLNASDDDYQVLRSLQQSLVDELCAKTYDDLRLTFADVLKSADSTEAFLQLLGLGIHCGSTGYFADIDVETGDQLIALLVAEWRQNVRPHIDRGSRSAALDDLSNLAHLIRNKKLSEGWNYANDAGVLKHLESSN